MRACRASPGGRETTPAAEESCPGSTKKRGGRFGEAAERVSIDEDDEELAALFSAAAATALHEGEREESGCIEGLCRRGAGKESRAEGEGEEVEVERGGGGG